MDQMAHQQQEEWTEDAEEVLINLWRNEPCLYDVNAKIYSNKHMRQKKIEEFSVIVGKSDAEVKRHLNSLRTQFMRYRKALPSGSAAKKRPARDSSGCWNNAHGLCHI
ncbi:uncharacterized protein LOC117125234 [Anneissia japonica]|uniref:uncharacterized protein LOC117125234 n=1 Tax=Anneissia japonica TaxID=1529436 RepID=UPI0014254BAD|nr:uncharacterized protein LOC117125234 [Anneissia japonica]